VDGGANKSRWQPTPTWPPNVVGASPGYGNRSPPLASYDEKLNLIMKIIELFGAQHFLQCLEKILRPYAAPPRRRVACGHDNEFPDVKVVNDLAPPDDVQHGNGEMGDGGLPTYPREKSSSCPA